jgi:hypothetical protein
VVIFFDIILFWQHYFVYNLSNKIKTKADEKLLNLKENDES